MRDLRVGMVSLHDLLDVSAICADRIFLSNIMLVAFYSQLHILDQVFQFECGRELGSFVRVIKCLFESCKIKGFALQSSFELRQLSRDRLSLLCVTEPARLRVGLFGAVTSFLVCLIRIQQRALVALNCADVPNLGQLKQLLSDLLLHKAG